MACSKYEYVKKFETPITLLPSTFIVVRIDGKGFTKFTDLHNFEKPNDIRGLSLMNKAAEEVLKVFNEIWLAYGQSDEYSFVFRRNTTFFSRRYEKIVTCLVSCFTAAFVLNFKAFFPEMELKETPMFDGRCVIYPDFKTLRDYLSWRQVDCHINNLYNTCFWALVKDKKLSTKDAQVILKDMKSDQKNELLFNDFGMNYNKIEAIYRKGTILIRKEEMKEKHLKVEKKEKEEKLEKIKEINEDKEEKEKEKKTKKEGPISTTKVIICLNEDMIGDEFWMKYKKELEYE